MPVPSSTIPSSHSPQSYTAMMLEHCPTNGCRKVEISDLNEVQVQFKRRTVLQY